jgi:hypothetical protein
MNNCDSIIKDFIACKKDDNLTELITCTVDTNNTTICTFNDVKCILSNDNKSAIENLGLNKSLDIKINDECKTDCKDGCN